MAVNPLVLNEGALHGHNDLVLVTIVLAGLWLVLQGRATFGVIVLLMAGLVKTNAWILAPVGCNMALRQRGSTEHCLRWCQPWCPASSSSGWPIPLRGWCAWSNWFATKLVADRHLDGRGVLCLRDGQGWPHETVVKVVIGSATLLFGITALLSLIKVRDLFICAWAVVLSYLLVGCHWFQPWYATWLVALTAIAANQRLVAYAQVLTCFMLLHPLVAQFVVAPLNLPL